ncbi:hypothetical protein NL676_015590 [Syzygium grande]|nr:hypothetical protein NL676_015590 [Syzygium grande]
MSESRPSRSGGPASRDGRWESDPTCTAGKPVVGSSCDQGRWFRRLLYFVGAGGGGAKLERSGGDHRAFHAPSAFCAGQTRGGAHSL